MKLKKAIEILTDCTQGALLGISEDTKDALKLGIEALKSVQHSRKIFPDVEVGFLPGKTTEEET